MKSLIIKDLAIQVKYLVFIIALFFLLMILGLPGGIFFNVGILTVAMRTAYLEEKNNTFVLLKTMPLKPTTIVLSKYVSLIIVSILFLLVSVVASLFGLGEGLDDMMAVAFGLPVMLVLVGLFFMLFFKFGYIKASNYTRIIFLLFFLLLFLPSVIPRLASVLISIENFLPVIALSLLIIYLATSLVSISFFKRREDF